MSRTVSRAPRVGGHPAAAKGDVTGAVRPALLCNTTDAALVAAAEPVASSSRLCAHVASTYHSHSLTAAGRTCPRGGDAP